MTNTRPDPDALLQKLQSEEQREHRGRLKLFLGASAGVGKTYAMLSEAQQLLNRKVDVVIGVIETHGRAETERVSTGLPVIGQRPVEYRGVTLRELDIDAVLARRPSLVLVDELAHTNVPGSRHIKRWQDVDELLEAGISVYSALNIQHMESLNDVVAQITGVQVKETVPDAFVQKADEIELIDISPDELRERLREGKVYVPTQVDVALEGFFRKGNLIALRELALRTAADQVDTQMQLYRKDEGIRALWATRQRVLVCIAPNRLGGKVVRAAARIGKTVHSEMVALYVESDRQARRSDEERARAEEALRLAEEMGIETSRRTAHDIVGEILAFAASKNVSLIVVGKPIKQRWKEILHGSVVDELVRRSGDINVYVISDDAQDGPTRRRLPKLTPNTQDNPIDYVVSVTACIVATGLSALIYAHLPDANVVMLYLLGIALASYRTGIRPALACSILSVACYDFFFVKPRFQFSVSDAAYLPTFMVMLGAGLLIATLTQRLKAEANHSVARERRTSALYEVTRAMAKSRGRQEIADAAADRIRDDFHLDVAVMTPNERGRLTPLARSRSHFENDHTEWPVAQWAFDNGKLAGTTTDTLPSAKGFYIPLISGTTSQGVLGVKPLVEGEALDPSLQTLMQTFASGLAVALERAQLARESHRARLEAESEKLRNALLSSVSHDIRSPLTAIAGAASSLLEHRGDADVLAETIYKESQRLNRHVRNLLDMTRLESGTVKPNLDWNNVEELVGGALARSESVLSDHPIETELPPDLPLIRVDGPLIEQALVNLLENAGRHTPPGTHVLVAARIEGRNLALRVIDNGPGISEEIASHIFDKFESFDPTRQGFGLGLPIVRAILRIHEGEAKLEARTPGATFLLLIPLSNNPPEVPIV